MTDQAPQSEAQAGPQIQIMAQYIKDLSFENPNAVSLLTSGQPMPQVQLGIDVSHRDMTQGQYEIVLRIRAEAKGANNDVFFVCELAYGALARLPQLPNEALGQVLYVVVPMLMFPAARQILGDATREGGYPPLYLQPIDFAALYRAKLNQIAQARAAQQGTDATEQDDKAQSNDAPANKKKKGAA